MRSYCYIMPFISFKSVPKINIVRPRKLRLNHRLRTKLMNECMHANETKAFRKRQHPLLLLFQRSFVMCRAHLSISVNRLSHRFIETSIVAAFDH